MASIPGFQVSITGASGSMGALSPKSSWRAYILPRGGYASQDSTGTLITFDTAAVASRFAVNNWIQRGLATADIRQVSAVGGNSISVSGAALTVTENDRIFLVGSTQPTVSGGSATYTVPATRIFQRDDDTSDLYTNSMITSNSDGLIQGFASTNFYDAIIQDGNRSNQGSIIDLTVGAVDGISTSNASVFGATVTFNAQTVFGHTVTINANLLIGSTGTALIPRLGPASSTDTGGAMRIIEGVTFPLTGAGIQVAINDLPVGGGIVLLGSSTSYTLSSNLSVVSGLILKGAGRSTILSGQVDIPDGTTDLVFEDIRFQPGATQYGVRANGVSISRINFTRCTFQNGLAGCNLTGGSTATIADVTFRDCTFETSGTGAAAGNLALTVVGNASLHSRNIGIYGCLFDRPVQLAVSLSQVTNANIVGNRFYDCATTTATDPFGGIWMSGTQRCIISDNIFDVPTGTTQSSRAITFRGGGGNTSHVVRGNIFRRTGPNAIETNPLSQAVIADNIFDSWQSAEGINLAGTGLPVEDVVIASNVFWRGQGHPIMCAATTGVTYQRVAIVGNVVDVHANDGITLNNEVKEFSIVGNVVGGSAGVGIKINTPNSGTVQAHHGTISGNMLRAQLGAGNGFTVDANNGTPRANIVAVGNYASGTWGGDAQVIAASTFTIVVRDSPYVHIQGTSAVTLGATPTIADGFDSQQLIIINSGASTITIQDQGTLPGSNLRLGASTRALGTRDNIRLIYNATIGDWVEEAFVNVT